MNKKAHKNTLCNSILFVTILVVHSDTYPNLFHFHIPVSSAIPLSQKFIPDSSIQADDYTSANNHSASLVSGAQVLFVG
jgi:hypothetical protein